jgi:hypothetical protein
MARKRENNPKPAASGDECATNNGFGQGFWETKQRAADHQGEGVLPLKKLAA